MKIFLRYLLRIIICGTAIGQSNVKVMAYNSLNYSGTNSKNEIIAKGGTIQQDTTSVNRYCFVDVFKGAPIVIDGKVVEEMIDSTQLYLTINGNEVEGELNYLPAGKDGQIGRFSGQIDKNGKIKTIYAYEQEGGTYKEGLIIEIKSDRALVKAAELEVEKGTGRLKTVDNDDEYQSLLKVDCGAEKSWTNENAIVLFEGHYEWEENSEIETFSVDIILNDNIYEGSYCAVAESGNKIDCGIEEDNPSFIFLESNENQFTVNFTTNYDLSNGKVTLELRGGKLYWKIVEQPEGLYFCPEEAILIKR